MTFGDAAITAGIQHSWNDNIISIKNQEFKATYQFHVEPDWSAASYWYAIAALSDEAELFFTGINTI